MLLELPDEGLDAFRFQAELIFRGFFLLVKGSHQNAEPLWLVVVERHGVAFGFHFDQGFAHRVGIARGEHLKVNGAGFDGGNGDGRLWSGLDLAAC